jgi:hypothetical protein
MLKRPAAELIRTGLKTHAGKLDLIFAVPCQFGIHQRPDSRPFGCFAAFLVNNYAPACLPAP